MATFTKAGISTGQTIQATHVTQIIDAFTKSGSYDLYTSGSIEFTGSVRSYNGFTGSLEGTASVAVNATLATESEKVQGGTVSPITAPVWAQANLKSIGGIAQIAGAGGGKDVSIDIPPLSGRTLGIDCFVSIAYSSSVTASDMQIGVGSLSGQTLTFTYDKGTGATPSTDIPFFFTILYTA